MNCTFGAAPNPAFKPGGAVISFIQYGQVKLDGIDGIRQPSSFEASADDAVWSGGGLLAVVRRGSIWEGLPSQLQRLGAGTEPSWSPDGSEIAAASGGWVVVLRVRDGRVRRVAAGSAPAFSPDGRFIAFVAPDHRLMIVATGARRSTPKPVGSLKAVSVDWQPKPRGPNPGGVGGCPIPPGAKTLASSGAALVIGDGLPLPELGFYNARPISYMGCLRADGRQRLLEKFDHNSVDGADVVNSAVLAAPYTALIDEWQDAHYGGRRTTVQVFDLRTGLLQNKLGGERLEECPDYYGGCDFDGGLRPVLLGSDGVSAAHIQQVEPVGSLSTPIDDVSCPSATVCVAAGRADTVFSSVSPTGGAAAWTSVPGPPVHALACPSASLCVGVGSGIFSATNPSGGTAAWTLRRPPGPNGYMNAVSCASPTLCVAARDDGAVATSTDPAGAWSVTHMDAGEAVDSVFCSALPQCFVTDSAQRVLTSTDPAGDAPAWTVARQTPPFRSGSCPTANLCVAVTGTGIALTTNPSAGPWTQTPLTSALNAVTCISASLCLAVGSGGELETSSDPASGVWTSATTDNGRDLHSISCPAVSLCVAVDSVGHVVTSTDPAGGPSTWTPALIDGDPCTDTTPCSVEQIVASAGTGVHTIDSSKLPGDGPFLTDLKLTHDVLSWSHDGTPRSATLR